MRMTRLAPALLLFAGCVEDLKVIRLKADGSGTIVYTRRMKEWAVETARKSGAVDEFTEEKARERIAELGQGVALVSTEKANRDGWIGMTSTYSFKDVTKLKLDGTDTTIQAENLANGNQKLTIAYRWKSSPADAKAKEMKASEEVKRALFSGMKFSVAVEVDGTIVKSSSPHFDGARLTVLEIDLDQLFAEEARLKKKAAEEPATLAEALDVIQALQLLNTLNGGAKELDEVRQALGKIKGIKHALEPQVTLEWTPKK